VEAIRINIDLKDELGRCENYGDIFDLVKKAVKKTLGRNRAGLMLYLGDLPLQVGAFHPVGSNGIVVNRRLLKMVNMSTKSVTEINSFIFHLLLHEYLHSLGYVSERHVRKLVYEVSRDNFGTDHPVTEMAVRGPRPKIHVPEIQNDERPGLELIRDFDRSNQTYIS